MDEFKSVKSKLENVASSISVNLKDFEAKLNDSRSAILGLKEQIRQLQEQLEKSTKEATSDFLTGLSTKRDLEAKLEKMDEEFLANGRHYCICFFDIDHFKNINDTYGHSAGDVILAKVGSILHKSAGDGDIIARFGGEEFVAVLPMRSLEEAEAYAQDILVQVRSFEFVYKNTKFNITISCGIASRLNCNSVKSCLDSADEMLYAAKHAGRNCVKVKVE